MHKCDQEIGEGKGTTENMLSLERQDKIVDESPTYANMNAFKGRIYFLYIRIF